MKIIQVSCNARCIHAEGTGITIIRFILIFKSSREYQYFNMNYYSSVPLRYSQRALCSWGGTGPLTATALLPPLGGMLL
jgi:hypothetical protein